MRFHANEALVCPPSIQDMISSVIKLISGLNFEEKIEAGQFRIIGRCTIHTDRADLEHHNVGMG